MGPLAVLINGIE